MKIKEGFMLREVAGNSVVVAVGENLDFNGMMTLNSTGTFLWNILKEDVSIDDLVNGLVNEYEIDEITAKDGALKFVEALKGADILE